MVFGRSSEEKHRRSQQKIIEKINGVREFAWFPVKLVNGRVAWLTNCYAYYRGGVNDDGSYFLWSASPDSYSPYAVYSLKRNKKLISVF